MALDGQARPVKAAAAWLRLGCALAAPWLLQGLDGLDFHRPAKRKGPRRRDLISTQQVLPRRSRPDSSCMEFFVLLARSNRHRRGPPRERDHP